MFYENKNNPWEMFLTHWGDPTGYLYVLQPSFYSGWKGVKTRFFCAGQIEINGINWIQTKTHQCFFFLIRSNYVHENDLD